MQPQKTGILSGKIPVTTKPLSVRDRVDMWFIKPLIRMKVEDGFVALMVCLPVIEAILRWKTGAQADKSANFSDGSELLKELANLLDLPKADAKIFWDQFRNGLLHQGMVKPLLPYQIDPSLPGRAVQFTKDRLVQINILTLRALVVDELNKYGTKIWRRKACPLPEVYISLVKLLP